MTYLCPRKYVLTYCMMKMMKKILVALVLLIAILFGGCKQKSNTIDNTKIPSLKERKKLIAVTDYNSTNYFLFNGQPMGFQYEMLRELSNYMGVEIEVLVGNDIEKKIEMLQNGEVDIIAMNLTVTGERKDLVDFTTPHSQTRQVLVQRKPEGWNFMRQDQLDIYMIRNVLDLANKDIHLQKNSSYIDRVNNLAEEIGDSIHITEVPIEVEELIAMVSKGEIKYTVCDENIAKICQSFYPNIDILTPVSFQQNLAWAVKKGSNELLGELNTWLEQFKTTRKYAAIYDKYFVNPTRTANYLDAYMAIQNGNFSAYDKLIKQYSNKLGWDWRLLASLIYQESRFNPTVKSYKGAYGLMQLMPETGKRFGVDTTSSIESQIRAGVDFLIWLNDRFKPEIPDDVERVKFVLAAYNVGYGHVLDARNLAVKYGKDPNKWNDNVDFYVLNKSEPRYYNDPVVKHGYCRGSETYKYVADIMERYVHYKNILN
jgi:membrane-bound lytic murein transglycosylase F